MSAFAAGVRLIPTSAGATFGGVVTGMIMRAVGKYYILNLFVQPLFLVPLFLTSLFTLDTPQWCPFVYFFFTGFAYAGMLTITVTALIAAVDQQYHAVITSASYAFRGTGSTIGITICSLIFQNILVKRLWETFGEEKNAGELIGDLRDRLSQIKYLPADGKPPSMREGAEVAYMDALSGVFAAIFWLAVAGSVSSLCMKERKLHTDLARRRA